MTEWLFEAGIGEMRAALVARGAIMEAAIEPDDGGPRVGAILTARLTAAGPRPVAVFMGGEAVLPRVPPGVTEGAALLIEIVREPIPEPGRPKRAKAQAAPIGAAPRPGPTLLDRIAASAHPVRRLRAHEPDALEAAGWSELLEEALTGEIAFSGGALRMSPTPAMTLFDVDGAAAPYPLALAAASAVAAAIRRHGVGGSIGIDFPTLAGKAERQAVAAAFDTGLADAGPSERTAVNGFGFLQVVRPRPRASLAELLRADPIGAEARAWLRLLERTAPGAPNRHRLPPNVVQWLHARPGYLHELARRTGRTPDLESD